MGTFPVASDYSRPIPQGVTGYASAPSVPGAPQESGVAAQTTAAAAQQIDRVADKIEDYSKILDTTQAQDAMNQLRKERQGLTYGDDGFQKVQGGDVLKPNAQGQSIIQSYNARLTAARDRISTNLTPRARMLFDARAADEETSFGKEILAHQMGESEKYQVAVFKDTQATLLTEAQRNAGNPDQLEAIADKAEKSARFYAQQKGLPADSLAIGARSNVYRTAIEDRISKNDPTGATGLYNLYKDKLDGPDAIKVASAVKTLETGEIARNFVMSGPSGESESAGRDMVIKARMAAGDDFATAAAWAANLKHESGFSTAAVNRRDGRDGSDSIGLGQWNAARAQALQKFAIAKGMDVNDPQLQLQYMQAEVDGTIPQSVSGLPADFKERLAAAKTADEKARLISAQFFRPLDNDGGKARERGLTAARYQQETAQKFDPLNRAVNVSAPQEGAAAKEGPPGFLDTKQMMIDLERWRVAKRAENMATYANNPAQLAANQHMIEQQYGLRQQRIELAKLELDKAVDTWMTKGGPGGGAAIDRPPPEVWNQLTYEKQKSVDATLLHNAKGRDAITDDATWYEIYRGLTSADPAERQKWASASLWQYKPKLSRNDFQELSKVQGTVRKGDPDKELSHVGSVNQMVDRTLTTLGIDPTPKPSTSPTSDAGKSAAFRRAVQDDLTAFEKQKGSKATPDETQKIIDRLTREVAGTGGWLSKTKRVFEMKIENVPKEERVKIEDALKRNGKPVNDQAIIELFSAKNAKAPK